MASGLWRTAGRAAFATDIRWAARRRRRSQRFLQECAGAASSGRQAHHSARLLGT
jgi:hypothetical protein